jgi:hypothetical protein
MEVPKKIESIDQNKSPPQRKNIPSPEARSGHDENDRAQEIKKSNSD